MMSKEGYKGWLVFFMFCVITPIIVVIGYTFLEGKDPHQLKKIEINEHYLKINKEKSNIHKMKIPEINFRKYFDNLICQKKIL